MSSYRLPPYPPQAPGLPPLKTVVDQRDPLPPLTKQHYLPSLPPTQTPRTQFQHNLPPSFNDFGSNSSQRADVPQEVSDRGADLLSVRSNFPTTHLPPLGIMPYGAEGMLERRGISGSAHGDVQDLTAINWDWGLPLTDVLDLKPGHQVEIRQLLRDGSPTWTSWVQATVVGKVAPRALLGTDLLFYEVEIHDSSRRVMVTPMAGEIWDGISQRPSLTAFEAQIFYAKIRAVYVPWRTIDPRTRRVTRTWHVGIIASTVIDPIITVQFCARAQRCTGFTGRFSPERMLPFTQRTTNILRAAGEILGETKF